MKWGKALNEKVSEHPTWSPYFLHFKLMKKELKAAKEMLEGTAPVPEDVELNMHGLKMKDGQTEAKLKEAADKALWPFLGSLNSELAATETFFEQRLESLAKKIGEVEKVRQQTADEEAGILALHELERNIKDLEEFAKLNFISASKILKKLDKNVGTDIKGLYTKEVLSCQNFLIAPPSTLKELQSRVVRILHSVSDISSGNEFIKESRVRSDLRDLNNDMSAGSASKHVCLCVPLRHKDGELEVIIIDESDGTARLAKAEIEAGESKADAIIREMRDTVGLRVTVDRFLGEFMSTSMRNCVYYAYAVHVDEEMEDWPRATVIRRRWAPISDVIADLEDNSAVRTLRAVLDSEAI